MNEEMKQKLLEFYKKNYKPKDGEINSSWSHGNSDDVFSDGGKFGTVWALYEIAQVLGLEVEEPVAQSEDYF